VKSKREVEGLEFGVLADDFFVCQLVLLRKAC